MQIKLRKLSALILFIITGSMINAQQKNILFIAVDDLKPVLNCYGKSEIISPNIDRLADRGIVFSNAYCAWSVCGPSRASMLSGLSPDGTGVKNLKTQLRDIRPAAVTLPQFFKNKGYETVGIGKVFDPRNVDDGHDSVSWTKRYIPINDYTYPDEYGPFVKGQYRVTANTVTEQGPEGVDFDGYEDGQSCLLALERLDEFAGEPQKHFFLAVGFKKPHIPFIAPEKYWDLYERDKIDLAPFQDTVAGAPDYIYYKPEPNPDKYVDIPSDWDYMDVTQLMDEDLQRRIIHGYYACTSYIDDLVGMLLNKLEENGMDRNTIIVLWGDHGYHLGDHNQWGKHTNFENGTHLPLIIAVPEGKGGISYRPVDSYDIYPTLVDLAGFEVPDYLQGNLLTRAIKGDTIIKTCAVSQFRAGGNMGYSFRTERYRFTAWMDKTSYIPTEIVWDESKIEDMELYDYVADALEKVNLAHDDDYSSVKDSLLAIAGNWWNEQHYFFTSGRNPKYIKDFNNILTNPDFEEGITSGWEFSQSNGFNATITVSSDAHVGSKAAQIDITSTGDKYDEGKLTTSEYNCMSGIRGHDVIVSFRAKATQPCSVKAELKIKQFNGKFEILRSSAIDLSSEYDSLSFEITVPESAAEWAMSVMLGKASGTVLIDDVRVTVLDDEHSSGIKKRYAGRELDIYPNPADDFFVIRDELGSDAKINIYTSAGKKILSSGLTKKKVDVSDLHKGMYIVEVADGKNRFSKKILIK